MAADKLDLQRALERRAESLTRLAALDGPALCHAEVTSALAEVQWPPQVGGQDGRREASRLATVTVAATFFWAPARGPDAAWMDFDVTGLAR